MINVSFNRSGCVLAAILLIAGIFLLKLWLLFIVGFVVYKFYKAIVSLINKNSEVKEEFVSTPGKVYKECRYCGGKTERSSIVCSSCGSFFE